ncbi:MAG: hypothetical protein V1755_06545 [Chloroflexota bacterium]
MSTETESLKHQWDRRESKQNGDTFAGIEYDSDLVSSRGCAITLYAPESADRSQIAKAKREARNQRDVVCFYVERVPDAWYPQDDHQPAKAAGSGWIDAARWIVANGQCRRVVPETGELVPESKRGGMLLDLFSAGRMVAVYDALNETNRAKFHAMDVRVAHHVAFAIDA